jgi:hypothetical protein
MAAPSDHSHYASSASSDLPGFFGLFILGEQPLELPLPQFSVRVRVAILKRTGPIQSMANLTNDFCGI